MAYNKIWTNGKSKQKIMNKIKITDLSNNRVKLNQCWTKQIIKWKYTDEENDKKSMNN